MNFFQILITLIIVVMLILIYRSRTVLFERMLFITLTLVGMYFVFSPESASKIANLVGIGRGADFVFYLFIIFSWFWFASTSAEIQRTNRRLTKIVRVIAVTNPLFGRTKSDKQ